MNPDPALIGAYLNQYPQGAFAEQAKQKLAALQPPQDPLSAWAAIQGSTDPAAYADFIKRFPDSPLASLAETLRAQYAPPEQERGFNVVQTETPPPQQSVAQQMPSPNPPDAQMPQQQVTPNAPNASAMIQPPQQQAMPNAPIVTPQPQAMPNTRPMAPQPQNTGTEMAMITPPATQPMPTTPPGPPNPQVMLLLSKAQEALAANRLLTPEENSAVRWSREALAIDPHSVEAAAIIGQVIDKYLLWGSSNVNRGRITKARRYLSNAQSLAQYADEIQIDKITELDRRIAAYKPRRSTRSSSRSSSPSTRTQSSTSSCGNNSSWLKRLDCKLGKKGKEWDRQINN